MSPGRREKMNKGRVGQKGERVRLSRFAGEDPPFSALCVLKALISRE